MLARCSTWLFVHCLAALVLALDAASLASEANSLPDAEQLQIARSLKQENDQQSRSEGTARAGGDGPHPELASEDGSVVVPATTPKDSSAPKGQMDGAMGFMRQRLASEEQFNQRLQQLLAKSTMESRQKQERLLAMQKEIAATVQSKKKLRAAFTASKSAEDADLAKEQSHADAVDKQLLAAGHTIGVERNTIMLLRERMGNVISHLRNVTHLGKFLVTEVADEKVKENVKAQELVAMQRKATLQQRRIQKWETKLHDIQASEESDEAGVNTIEHQNLLLEQHLASLSQRDEMLHNENTILRKVLRGRTLEGQKVMSEIQEAKASLASLQRSNAQLQDKYVDSKKDLLSSLSPDADPIAVPADDETYAPVDDASAMLMQLKESQKTTLRR